MAILRIGTLFSGIGAFEEALNQLGIKYNIEFACDNGEVELIPFPTAPERNRFRYLESHAKSLTEEEAIEHSILLERISQINENINKTCNTFPTKTQRTEYVDGLYHKYNANYINWVKRTYTQNYDIKPEDFHTDVRFLSCSEYKGKIDILVGGSPCQSFSNYGHKRGLEDARGTLFYDYARIIQECQPKVFIYENVASIKSNDHGRTWEVIQEVLESLEYNIFSDVIDAVDHDHPQQRKRLFMVGFREDVNNKGYAFPPKKELTHTSKDFLENGVIPDKYYLGQKGFEWITNTEKNQNRTRVNREIIGCETANQQDNWIGDLRVERPRPEHYQNPNIYIGKYDFGEGLEDAVGRKLTPRECLNLMGFSPDFNIENIPDGVLYRQSGNSIVVPVLKDIVLSILPYLK